MKDWLGITGNLLAKGQHCVLVTIAYTAGSAPREAGTKMVVGKDVIHGTIGGGNLEYNAIQTARSWLQDNSSETSKTFLDLYALGPILEQCCGGVVFLHYELITQDSCHWISLLSELDHRSSEAVVVTRTGKVDSDQLKGGKLIVTEFETSGSVANLDEYAVERARQILSANEVATQTLLHPLSESKGSLPDIDDALLFDVVRPCDFNIVLFGAGHVGRALVTLLDKTIPCNINWVDSRSDVFPPSLPNQIATYHATMPTNLVKEFPANSFFLVMTHSHELDLALCEAILKRGNFCFLGLIGSETKKRRFHKRLLEEGLSEKELVRLSCPIGVGGINSKEPGSIAISVIAQLLQIYESAQVKQYGPDSDNVISI